MHQTEFHFRELHQRLTFLEQRQASQGPTDEQVERVLRKILAERFSGIDAQRHETYTTTRDSGYCGEDRTFMKFPQAIMVDAATLIVNPDCIPSKEFGQTFDILESQLAGYPNESSDSYSHDDEFEDDHDTKPQVNIKTTRSSESV